jgi:hypothetical protein
MGFIALEAFRTVWASLDCSPIIDVGARLDLDGEVEMGLVDNVDAWGIGFGRGGEGFDVAAVGRS